MLLRRITDYILQSRLQAMGVAFVCAFIPVLGSISIVIAALVTLRKGTFEGSLVVLAASLPILIGFMMGSQADTLPDYPISLAAIILVLLASNVLTWLFAVLLRQYSSWSLVLQLTAFVSIVAIAVVHVIYPDIQNWWATQLANYFVKTLQATGQVNPDDVKPDSTMIVQLVSIAKPYATGMVIAFLTFNALLQLLLARWWQAAMFNPGGLRKELMGVRMGYTAGATFIIGLMLSYWGNEVVVDVMPVIYLTFGLAGFSLMHCLFAKVKFGWFWLVLAYIIVMIFGFTPIAIVALLDTWFDFRKRMAQQI
ncbi:MAG: hypothetical protein P4M14_02820 [Gammaproteobacteria bacterium]|nr:hypothetical protein [Gammaproteobacteria bacterium]